MNVFSHWVLQQNSVPLLQDLSHIVGAVPLTFDGRKEDGELHETQISLLIQ